MAQAFSAPESITVFLIASEHCVQRNLSTGIAYRGGLMIELEIQGLSPNREGLLIDVGRFAMANGFTLQRQRLVKDPHGFLLSMVVRGPPRGKKALQAALDSYQRFISVQLLAVVEGEVKPHFAASLPHAPYTPPPAPALNQHPKPAFAAARPSVSAPATVPTRDFTQTAEVVVASAPAEPLPTCQARPGELDPEPEFEFIQPTQRAPEPPAEVVVPFVEVVALAADEAAVERMLQGLAQHYPKIVPQLQTLQQSVADGARDPSLALAGKRTGQWVFQNEYLLDDGLPLAEAIERLGVPSLLALTEVEQEGAQLHILDSPLCSKDGPSGCSFFGGFLEGLLEPAIAPGTLSIFPVCCRSYGADACVLALSD